MATIRVSAPKIEAAAEVYYADELGFFKKNGISVGVL
jgi:ABC-type nitrate/sulfonate/bicarbonate transport system substrate-binding protein